MADFRIRISVDPKDALRGINQVSGGLNRLERKGHQISGVFKAAAVLGIVQMAKGYAGAFVDIVDGYTMMENRIRSSTKTQKDFQKVMAEVPKVAQRSRADLESIAKGYQAISGATEEMGLSSDTILRMTETLAKGMVASGATTAETASVMTQFSQALRKGKLDGDEFRSIMENGIVVQRLLAKEMGVSTAALKGLSTQGEITREVMVNALVNGASEVDAQFAQTMPTITDQITQFKNEMILVAGEFNKSINLGGMVGAVFSKMAQDIALTAKALGTVIGGFVELESKINSLTGGASRTAMGIVGEVTSTVLSPLKQIGYAIEGYEALRASSDRLSNSEIRERMGETGFMLVPPYLDEEVNRLRDAREELDHVAKSLEGLSKNTTLFVNFSGEVHKRAEDLRNMAGAVNSVTDAIERAQAIGLFVQLTGDFGEQAVQRKKDIEGMAAAVDSVTAAVEKANAAGAGVQLFQGAKDTAAVLRAVLEGKSEEEVRAAAGSNNALPFILDSLYEGDDTKKTRGSKDTFPDELRRLLASIDPLIGAQQDLTETENTLEKAVRRKMLTAGQAASFLERYKEMHEDALDPIGAFTRATKAEADILELRWRIQTKADSFGITRQGFATTEAYEIEVQALTKINELKEAGILFSKEQEAATLAEYRAQLKKLQAMQMGVDAITDLESRQKDLIDKVGGKTGEERFFEDWARIKQKETAGLISAEFAAREIARIAADTSYDYGRIVSPVEELNNQIADLRIAMLQRKFKPEDIKKAVDELRAEFFEEIQKNSPNKQGNKPGDRQQGTPERLRGFEGYIQSISDTSGQMADIVEQNAQRMEDALVKFFRTGEFGMEAMVNAMLDDLTRFLVRFLIVQGAKAIFGPGFGVPGGGPVPGASARVTNPMGDLIPISQIPTGGLSNSTSSERRKPEVPKLSVETRVVRDSRGAALAVMQSPAGKKIQFANLQENEVALRGLQGRLR